MMPSTSRLRRSSGRARHSMKATTPAVTAFLNAARAGPTRRSPSPNASLSRCDDGTAYTWTNVDQPVVYNGLHLHAADGPLVQGLKYKGSVGLDVDKQQITIAARPTDLVNGAPFLEALRDGAFDGASVQRDRVFMTAPGAAADRRRDRCSRAACRPSTMSAGRTSATITVACDLVILDYDMPRNLYSPTCLHTLYDSGCGVPRGNLCGDRDRRRRARRQINSASTGALAHHAQGSLVFTSGANANVRATVKSVSAGAALTLMYPLPPRPQPATPSPSTPAATTRRRRARAGSTTSPTSAASPTSRRRRWLTKNPSPKGPKRARRAVARAHRSLSPTEHCWP